MSETLIGRRKLNCTEKNWECPEVPLTLQCRSLGIFAGFGNWSMLRSATKFFLPVHSSIMAEEWFHNSYPPSAKSYMSSTSFVRRSFPNPICTFTFWLPLLLRTFSSHRSGRWEKYFLRRGRQSENFKIPATALTIYSNVSRKLGKTGSVQQFDFYQSYL